MVITLRDVPKDVKDYILAKQKDLKKKKKVKQLSQYAAVYQIIREHKKCVEFVED